jgi:hypothetical protein
VDIVAWLNRKRHVTPFAVTMCWRELKDHISDCYVCSTDVSGHTSKNKRCIEYSNLPSDFRPVPLSDGLPIPDRPESWHLEDGAEAHLDVDDMDRYVPPHSENNI